MKLGNLLLKNYLVSSAVILFCVFSSFSGIAQKKDLKAVSEHTGFQTKDTTSKDYYYRDLFTDIWVASDALGRKMPAFTEVGAVKTDKRRA